MSLASVTDLLHLRSSEASLVCVNGHIAGHPFMCAGGCVLIPTDGTTMIVLRHKQPSLLVGVVPPIQIEEGWLVDGHHRLASAVAHHVPVLPFEHVSGVLAEQRAFHAEIARTCRHAPPHR